MLLVNKVEQISSSASRAGGVVLPGHAHINLLA